MSVRSATHRIDDVDVHTWHLRDVEFEDGVSTRCFECVECGTVRYD